MSECQQCGMIVSTGEYHPYAACVLFKHLRQGDKVRELIRSVQADSSTRLQRAEELLERCKPAVKGYGWRFHQVGQNAIGDEWWGLRDDIDAFLGESHD